MPAACSPATILVVDDDPVTAQTFAQMLTLEGYRVFTALTVTSGLEEVATHPPDAILLDLRMPVEDGLDFLRRLRARRSPVPVAVVTGDYYVEEALIDQLHGLEARAVTFKPLWLDRLTALVEELIGGQGAVRKP